MPMARKFGNIGIKLLREKINATILEKSYRRLTASCSVYI
ncbi:5302_t:CDS:2 [Gigaspora margarita]|uniref:5302_t:CDS:1 n=1 Tax=Gigaspora margarita TaxID=4874 RepID=A0ABM8VWB0_GIGMA|nr:5302_t:CDS:2 [Gigaspora margarita]